MMTVLLLVSFFSPFHQLSTDDRRCGWKNRLHSLLSLTISNAFAILMFFSSRSCLTLSIHCFLGIPLIRFPSMLQCNAIFGICVVFIPVTCPNHISLFVCILCTIVSLCQSFSLMTAFLNLWILEIPNVCLNQLISVTSIFCSSSFLSVQHYDPYNAIGLTSVS